VVVVVMDQSMVLAVQVAVVMVQELLELQTLVVVVAEKVAQEVQESLFLHILILIQL
jgi:hypothetical protein